MPGAGALCGIVLRPQADFDLTLTLPRHTASQEKPR